MKGMYVCWILQNQHTYIQKLVNEIMLSTIIIVMHYLHDTQQKITQQQQQQQQNKEPRYHGDSQTECQQCAPQSYGHMIMTQ